MENKRLRFTPTGLHVREAREEGQQSRTIEGCAIVFGQETVLYESDGYREIEVIDASCVTAEFLKTQDIKMNLLHDRKSSMARSVNGEGSLNLELREDGLYFSFEAPECDLGDQALALVKNGTYSGCSFEFYPKDYDVMERTRGEYVIVHKEFERLTALTIAMDPAYEQTSVNLREAYEAQHPEAREETARQELEAREKKIREQKARYYATL